jgi:hypothetical protein
MSEFDDEMVCAAHIIYDEDSDTTPESTDKQAKSNSSLSIHGQNDNTPHSGTPFSDIDHTPPGQEYIPHIIPDDHPQTSELQREGDVHVDGIDPIEEVPTPRIKDDAHILMNWHIRLGHLPFSRLKQMALKGILPKRLAHLDSPVCLACQFGKATKRAWRSKTTPSTVQVTKVSRPGDCISVDQLQSSTPGFVAQMKGALTKARYTGATIFVDHFSRLCYLYPQKSLSAEETLQAKQAFEAFAKSHGVTIKHYHADNGRFAENVWKQDVTSKGQTLSFCGAHAHFQNGIAEKFIRDIQDQARTMLLHAKHRWPQAVTHHLWPYALRMANNVRNSTPRSYDQPSPLEMFSSTEIQPNLQHHHAFGCPVYVYEKGQTKWDERARLGMYLGHSPVHAKSVALVLNLSTGLVSPQFHVKFDDHFSSLKDTPPTVSERWTFLAGLTKDNVEDSRPSNIWTLTPAVSTNTSKDLTPIQNTPAVASEDTSAVQVLGPQVQSEVTVPLAAAPLASPKERLASTEIISLEALMCSPGEDSSDAQPIAYLAHRDPDTLYLQEAMKAKDKKNFLAAMQEEIRQHDENNHWELVERSSLDPNLKVLPAVWAMKRKRRIGTREVYKWKARLNVHGGKQVFGEHYTETYSPVIGWSTIRLFLILSILYGWHTRQLDFVMAYTQADIEKPLYMELPSGINYKGIDKRDYVLKLLKNLYGQKQAGRVWNKYLLDGLSELGFTQSKVDECLLYRDDVAILIYVDDTILCSKSKMHLEKAIRDIESKFKIQEVGDIQDFLGVHVEKTSEGGFKLTQPHLVDSILEEVGFHKDAKNRPKGKDLPALTSSILKRDSEGADFDEQWDYRRIIGKLNFLEKSTRPDIAYIVHQCARFQAKPKASHAKAIKHLARYLLSTRDKGLIFQVNGSGLECFADADFAGNWSKDEAEFDPSTAQSRTGYTILYAGCPLIWISRLQTEIALSTTEAEYIALSQALRDVIPIMNLLQELKDHKFITDLNLPTIHCKAFEDNSGALEIAKTPKMRPRTKHLNIKYHHFRQQVANGMISLHKVSTNHQIADLLTKPLDLTLFLKHRFKIMGW